jgi:hypothetical protein
VIDNGLAPLDAKLRKLTPATSNPRKQEQLENMTGNTVSPNASRSDSAKNLIGHKVVSCRSRNRNVTNAR